MSIRHKRGWNRQSAGFGEAVSKGNESVVTLIALRVLVRLNGVNKFVDKSYLSDDSLAEFLGLGHWVHNESLEYNPKLVKHEILKLHKEAEQQPLCFPQHLNKSVDELENLIELNDADKAVLKFALMLNEESLLETVTDYLGSLTNRKLFHVLSILLELPEKSIKDSLHKNSRLSRAGLLELNTGQSHLDRKLDFISERFADDLGAGECDVFALLQDFIKPSTKTELTLSQYSVIEGQLTLLKPFLKSVTDNRTKGANFFIYGPPGTGKTELVKLLAQEFGQSLYEVSSEDRDGDPIKGSGRLRALNAGQQALKDKDCFMLFDEVEDIFNDGNGERSSTAQERKAWMNTMLEENPVPCFWLSNTPLGLDPAFMRRFSFVFELPIPDKQQRAAIINHYTDGQLSEQTVKALSASNSLSPAVVAQMTKVASSVGASINQSEMSKDEAYVSLINNSLKAQGHKAIKLNRADSLPEYYSLDFINTDIDCHELMQGLKQHDSARICFYGPPGTGKSAFGRYIAEQLGKELILKKASDLLGMYVGETEKNIARAFEEADRNDAVLMFDEVDSFLQDRRNAKQSWEISQVNEMLTQMESFDGLFIASTNLMDGLDQAVLRRFDLKAELCYLKANQLDKLFCEFAHDLGISGSIAESKVASLNAITPGDFAAIKRQSRFKPLTSLDQLFDALVAEQNLKQGKSKPIGFLH